ncbi:MULTISPECIES: Crp/Fnr family transcriptional regulator [unclassified Acinetobacter]|uniref:Crp/Fnr family transcriptional regulator n=1 Tax=unclassified Acinetobacter TaxID=196816 RepID=UPI00190C4F8C|nr:MULTISPECIES: Crp/Fnr family transcriptional regulator [unclassified Acinetobacter]MBK0062923.1 Crp/Fnr family transcriptional regulator [Acinetobacter sp. S55]MBK0066659.1 Crp/Fnr family transcriptional regulator [Acinetobacter sp. S54]
MLDTKFHAHLQRNLWFSQLPILFQNFIFENAKLLNLEKNQAAFYAGDAFDGIYALLEGSIEICSTNEHGNHFLIAIFEPINWFGEISLVDQSPRSHQAVAVKSSKVLYLSQKNLDLLLKSYPEGWYFLAQLISQKLRFAFLELNAIHSRSLLQHLAQRLNFILQGYGNIENIENFVIQISQEKLAQMLACSRQTINQLLQELEKKKIVEVNFGKIIIKDYEQLKYIANSIPFDSKND